MKRLAIYLGPFAYGDKWDERNLEIGVIGGSEIWAIELSNEFVGRGYDVTLFADPSVEHDSPIGVHYAFWQTFRQVAASKPFDYIITSRRVDEITDDIPCDNIILMCHDTIVIGCEKKEDLKLHKIKKVCYQSLFQKYMLKKKYGLTNDDFMRTYEGIEMDRYADVDSFKKENKMLLSSGKGRGTEWLVKNVFPKIRSAVPDFQLNICGYFDKFSEPIYHQDGINLLGCVSKDELVRQQKESKIWVYPNHGYSTDGSLNAETFSITAIENAVAKCACILSNWGCFYSTLREYDGFVGSNLYQNIYLPMDNSNMKKFADLLANEAIKCLTNEEYRLNKVESSYNAAKKYDWALAADSFEKEWNS